MIKPDGKDALYITGLVLLVCGALAISWKMAMMAAGFVLVLTAVAAARRT